MGWLAVALTVLAQPAVQVDARSRCAANIVEAELAAAGLKVDSRSELRLQVDDDGRVWLYRGDELVLSRALGHGSCPTFARAAALVVSRWAKALSRPQQPQTEAASPSSVVAPSNDARRQAPPVQVAAEPPRADVRMPYVESTPDIVRAPALSVPPSDVAEPLGVPPMVLAPEPESVPEPEPEPVSALVASTSTIQLTGYEALVGGGFRAPGSVQIAPVVTLDLALLLQARLRVGMLGVFDFGDSLKVVDENGAQRGLLSTRGGLILPQAAWCWGDVFRGCLGAAIGGRIVSATASGPYVFQSATQTVPSWVLGPTAQASFRWGWVRGAIDVSAWVTPLPPSFGVEGLNSLSVPVLQGHARLSLGIARGP